MRRHRFWFFVATLLGGLLVLGANPSARAAAGAYAGPPPVVITEEARRVHREALLIDGHNDLPHMLRTRAGGSFDVIDIGEHVPELHTDIPRLRAGGVGAQFWAAYVPSITLRTGGAARQTLEQIDLIQRMARRYPQVFELARTADDIVRIRRTGKIACLIGIEGGHAIEQSLALLRMYAALGVRYMTLTHADNVGWADAATDKPASGGLSDFGREVVREMNRLGMLVDISHVAPATMHAALDIAQAPVIASHSSAFARAPHPRNVPDEVLRRIRSNGGVIMVNFFSGFLVAESARAMTDMFEIARQLRQKHPSDQEFEAAMEAWRKAHPMPSGSVKDLVDHIDHIVKIAGVDHVGLGGDYDGVKQLPAQLEDVSGYPIITQELLNRRYAESDIKKILGGNTLRVLREAEVAATRLQTESPPSAAK